MYYVTEHLYILGNFFFIEVWLIYSAELVSGVQSDHTHTHTHIFFRFFSSIGFYKMD